MRIILVVLFSLTALGHSAAASGDAIKVAYIGGTELFVLSELGGHVRQVTKDGFEKTLPVWSGDGSVIAFLERANSDESCGKVAVVDLDGNVLYSVELQNSLGGMRFVERLEWLNHDEIAVSGSVNPSLTETVVLNIKKRTYQGGIFDDGPGADFSPDGKHIAYTSGSPHFTPENRREPALNVDHERVFPKEGTRIRFVSDRRWSPDSSRLAVISEDFVTNRRSVVVWREDGSVSIIALGLPTKTKTDLFWNGGDLMITYDGGSLRIAPTTATLEKSFSKAINPLQQAQSERNRLREVVKNHASRDVDFWCQACPLNVLPRRVPTEYE